MDCLPTLEGERVRLRWLVDDDAPAIFEIFGDPRVTASMGIETRRDEAHARELIEEIQAHARGDGLYQWGIARCLDDRVIGTVTLASIDRKNLRAEVGFALANAQQGQGYATEAVRAGLDHAFGAMGLHRIEADVDPRNAASIALLERLGFCKEGYMRQRWRIDGQWQDTVFYGLLAHLWSPRGSQRCG